MTSLAYERHGDPAAPSVLLLGSLGSDRRMWSPQIVALSPIATSSRSTIVGTVNLILLQVPTRWPNSPEMF